ncbi:hypothetical protein V5T82_14965 [Magnetovibrio sp. PR-2]|uniref:hypothetical protein n=1 Tax=Magnetovibrio sp. PR-2 TaxID=3120356 RepID=UPI002FCDFCDD
MSELQEAVDTLGTSDDQAHFERYGPTTCPEAPRQQHNIDFRVTQASDCAIISAEISSAGVINLLAHCATACLALLTKGLMIRGYITRGKILHTNDHQIGTGLNTAASREKHVAVFQQNADDRGTPFIEIDSSVVAYVNSQSDDCVKKIFDSQVKNDGELYAIFPFERLNHSFAIGGFGVQFDPNKEKMQVDVVRGIIHRLKEQVERHIDKDNADAVRKSHHYLRVLDDQLVVCDRTEEMIDRLCRPFPN